MSVPPVPNTLLAQASTNAQSPLSRQMSVQQSPVAVAVRDFSSLPTQYQPICNQWYQEAQLKRNRQQYHDAIVLYDKILELLPTHLLCWIGKGQCYKLLKDTVSAVECFQKSLSLDPTDWYVHDQLGLIFKETELFERAMEEYKLAIQYCPDKVCPATEHFAIALTDFGTRLKSNSPDQALRSYLDAITIHPTYWPAYFNLGVIASEKGDFESSMRYYQQAVEHNPNYVEALCNIGVLYKNSQELPLG